MKQILSAALAAILVFTACTKRDTQDPWIANRLAATTTLNEHYGSDPAQTMDVYLPEGRSLGDTGTPMLVIIHGGAWSSGDKADMTPYIAPIRQRLPHWAIANVNYRLAQPPSNVFPTQESDVQAAINYIYAHRNTWQISDHYALLGYSSGGQLALLHAYKRATPVAIEAVLALAGPSNMEDLYNYQMPAMQIGLQMLLNGTPASNPVAYQQSSALTFLGPHNPPTFLVHGGLDSLVPYQQSEVLQARLTSLGVPASYIFFPNETHILHDTTILSSIDTATNFLRHYIH